jgi:hypothetical protein
MGERNIVNILINRTPVLTLWAATVAGRIKCSTAFATSAAARDYSH